MSRPWRRYYRGWVITHDPHGILACYRGHGRILRWCYFGSSIDTIKLAIDRREDLIQQLAEVYHEQQA